MSALVQTPKERFQVSESSRKERRKGNDSTTSVPKPSVLSHESPSRSSGWRRRRSAGGKLGWVGYTHETPKVEKNEGQQTNERTRRVEKLTLPPSPPLPPLPPLHPSDQSSPILQVCLLRAGGPARSQRNETSSRERERSEKGRRTNLSKIMPPRASSDGEFLRGVGVVFGVGEVDGKFLFSRRTKRDERTSDEDETSERRSIKMNKGDERGC